MYYRYAVATQDELKERHFKTKRRAIEYAQGVTIDQKIGTTVYMQRVYPDTGMVDIILSVCYWWDDGFQYQKLS